MPAIGPIVIRRYFTAALFILSLLPVSAHAQSLSGKTIVYTAVDGSVTGYIFVAPGGTVYWSAAAASYGFGSKDKGIRFRLGRSFGENHDGCQSNTTASLAGNVLALNAASSCPSLQFNDVQNITVNVQGDNCSVVHSTKYQGTQTGNSSGVTRSETCRVVSGNQIR